MVYGIILLGGSEPFFTCHWREIPTHHSPVTEMHRCIQTEKHRYLLSLSLHKTHMTGMYIGMHSSMIMQCYHCIKDWRQHLACLFESEPASHIPNILLKCVSIKILNHIIICIVGMKCLYDIYNPRTTARQIDTFTACTYECLKTTVDRRSDIIRGYYGHAVCSTAGTSHHHLFSDHHRHLDNRAGTTHRDDSLISETLTVTAQYPHDTVRMFYALYHCAGRKRFFRHHTTDTLIFLTYYLYILNSVHIAYHPQHISWRKYRDSISLDITVASLHSNQECFICLPEPGCDDCLANHRRILSQTHTRQAHIVDSRRSLRVIVGLNYRK